ncbi:MAG: glycosyltransferase [Planctomycetaceae bacterium]|nr:glycosyltransferase [Planctomycetaceae bacterium]
MVDYKEVPVLNKPTPDVSIVVPIHNELENLPRLYAEVCAALDHQSYSFELILVDDGSTDGSIGVIKQLAAKDPRVKSVILRRNFGQTAAMQAGIDHALGQVLVTLDGDLQNDPADIPMLLDKINEGCDLVHGWRKQRHDFFLSRRLPSKIANWLISRTTKFPIHDLGCTLKAIRREIACELNLYGEMHRFIPILAHLRGARCCEVVTHHRPRIHGKTKYGLDRTLRVVLDLMTVWYMQRFLVSPMKLFGGIGIITFIASLLCCLTCVVMKIVGGFDITGNPMFMLSAISGLASIQFFSLGLMGEVGTRTYFHSADRTSYAVRETLGWEAEAAPIIEFRSATKAA